jgi:hypothetical protein
MYKIHPTPLGVLYVATRRTCVHLARRPPAVLDPPQFPLLIHPRLPSHLVPTVTPPQVSGYALSAEISGVGQWEVRPRPYSCTLQAHDTCICIGAQTKRVWDYAGDGYVHRLIQNKPMASWSNCSLRRRCAQALSTTAGWEVPALRIR